MKNTSVVDANVILRFLLRDHETLSPKAKVFWDDSADGKHDALIPEAVLAECAYVLQKLCGVPRLEVATSLLAFTSRKGLVFESRERITRALLVFKERNISFVDALIIATATLGGHTITSFDAGLNKAASKTS